MNAAIDHSETRYRGRARRSVSRHVIGNVATLAAKQTLEVRTTEGFLNASKEHH